MNLLSFKNKERDRSLALLNMQRLNYRLSLFLYLELDYNGVSSVFQFF